MRNVLAPAGKSGRRVASAFITTAFAQENAEAARAQWRTVADQIRPKVPRLAAIMDDAETDVLAYMTFPKEHRAKLHSTNPLLPFHAVFDSWPPSSDCCRVSVAESDSHGVGPYFCGATMGQDLITDGRDEFPFLC